MSGRERKAMHNHWNLIVIGAGPSGMNTATAAAKHGASVLVLERQEAIGGQIYRNIECAPEEQIEFLGKDYGKGAAITAEFRKSSAALLTGATVWAVENGKVHVSVKNESKVFTCDHLVLAGGAVERPAPVKGWTLPGVMGAGAADVLLKSSGVKPDGPVVLCGNGPLLLQSALHMYELGIEVAGMVLTGTSKNLLGTLPHLLRPMARPLYFAKGGIMVANLIKKGIPRYVGATGLSIARSDEQLRIDFAVKGARKSIEAATVLLHEGVIPDTRLSRLAGCQHDWNPVQRYWYVRSSVWGETSLKGIHVAGDSSGVHGAEAAASKGTLTGLEICRKLGRISRAVRDEEGRASLRALQRIQFSQPYLDAFFAPNLDALRPDGDTIVCRCEELTAKTIRSYIRSGCSTPDGIKAQSRSGMGQCQGRMCEQTIIELIAHEHGTDADAVSPYKIQKPLYPVTLEELSNIDQ